MLAVLLGGIVSDHGYVYALVPSVIAPLLAAVVLVTLSPVQKIRSTGEKRYWHVLRLALKEASQKPALLQLMVYMALVFGVAMAADDFWSLLFHDLGLSLTMVGVMFALANVVVALASYTAHAWRMSPKQEYVLILFGGLLLFVVAWLHTPWSILLTFGTAFCTQLASVKAEVRLQHSISSNQRATVSSLNSLLLQIMVIIFVLIIGALSTRFGMTAFLYVLGGVSSITAVIFLALKQPRSTYGVNRLTPR